MEDYNIKSRKEAGRVPGPIVTVPPILTASIQENPEMYERQILPEKIDKICDSTVSISLHEVNTEKASLSHNSMMHVEGGWPKEINASEHQETSKWRKRIERDPGFLSSLKKLTSTASSIIDRNTGLDMYELYFDNEALQLSTENYSSKIQTVFKDPCESVKRKVTSISWQPDGLHKFSASYFVYPSTFGVDKLSTTSFVWDSNLSSTPLIELKGSSPVLSIQYNHRQTDLLIGGTQSGIVELWDLRKGSEPAESSNLVNSHSSSVNAISWIQSKTNNEFISVSSDGFAFWWDYRNLSSPIDQLELVETEKDQQINLGGRSVECLLEAGHGKYLIGTEQGSILSVFRSPKKGIEVIQRYNLSGKMGPTHCIKRNPSHPQYFFSINDWAMRLWNEEVKTPISIIPYSAAPVICGQWSPTRPGLCLLGRQDGALDFVDLLEKHNEISFSHKVNSSAICAISMHRKGKLVAIGDNDGTISILELNEALYVENYAEKVTVEKNLERETRKEKKIEIAKKRANLSEEAPKFQLPSINTSKNADEEMKLIEKDFFKAVGLKLNSDKI